MGVLPANHRLWRSTENSYIELRKSMINFIEKIVSANASRENAIAAKVLKDTVYSRGWSLVLD